MQTGTLAMFDALGFKRIWSRADVKADPQCVIQKLINSERSARNFIEKSFGSTDGAIAHSGNQLGGLKVLFLSDTIVVGVFSKSREQLAAAEVPYSVEWNMLTACSYASAIQRSAALSPPPLAYRGCVTYGQFDVQENFLIGPAIDEAAESMDKAQGAFTWLTSSALARLDHVKSELASLASHSLVPYRVPLKGGDAFETFTVCPFDWAGLPAGYGSVSSAILDTFVGSLDVDIKRQNTARFFTYAEEHYAKLRGPQP